MRHLKSKSNGPGDIAPAVTVDQLTNKRGVAKAAGVSPRLVDRWIQEKKIPSILLSPRCRRFHLPSVMAALRRYTVEEVK